MLIEIKNHGSFDPNNALHLTAIENLIKAFGERKHIILCDRTFLRDTIAKLDALSTTTKMQAIELYRAQLEYAQIVPHIEIVVYVDFNMSGNAYHWSNPANKKVFHCTASFFQDSISIQKSKVICENPSDADFYEIVALEYLKNINANGSCPPVFDAINGGGGSTRATFDRFVSNNELVLCILDNDKKHPESSRGSTCRAFNNVTSNVTGLVNVLDAHEVECLIPQYLLREVTEKNGINREQQFSLNFWDRVTEIREDAKFYYDHKNGLDLKKVLQLDVSHTPYWRPILSQTNELRESVCVGQGVCSCEPGCFKVDGYGSDILTKTVDHIKYGNLKAFKPKLTPQMKRIWSDIGSIFFSWCCAPPKKAKI